jgi:hypothetical protein
VVTSQVAAVVEYSIMAAVLSVVMAAVAAAVLVPMAYPMDLMQMHRLDQVAAVVAMVNLATAPEMAATAQAVL